MSRAHRRLTRTWHATARRFKHGQEWYTYDIRVPKVVRYATEHGLMTWPKRCWPGFYEQFFANRGDPVGS